jgi:hypothetical protein
VCLLLGGTLIAYTCTPLNICLILYRKHVKGEPELLYGGGSDNQDA